MSFLKPVSPHAKKMETTTVTLINFTTTDWFNWKNKYKGAIFWTVLNKKKISQVKPSLRLINQVWKGAAPSFNINLLVNTSKIKLLYWNFKKTTLNKNIPEPRLWIKKYFIFKESWVIWVLAINPKNKIKFNSRAIQNEKNWLADKAK